MGGTGSGRKLSTEISKKLGFSFNARLDKNLRILRNAVLNQDFDAIILVDGNEGGGKSVLGMQVGYYLDIDHELDIETQVIFTPDGLKEAITTLKPGKCIVWDEARRGVNRRRSTKAVNIEITDLLAECRQNNLFVVVIMPSFYDMDMNVAVWRSRILLHVWYDWNSGDDTKPLRRGFFRFYSETGKKQLYTNKYTRQGYQYPYMKNQCFDSHFPHYYVVDEEVYRAKKKKSEEEYRKGDDTKRKPCPDCGAMRLAFNRTKSKWYCQTCTWDGPKVSLPGRDKTTIKKRS